MAWESSRVSSLLFHLRSSWVRYSAVAIVLIAGLLRFVRLGSPHQMIVLDEEFYVPDARSIIAHGSETHFVVHPPVAKWFIAAGIKVFGDNPFGWRAGAALAGTLGVLVIYLLARRLWSSATMASTAAILLAVDGLWFVQSRMAMLDIYVAVFALLGTWLLVEDRARTVLGHRGLRWWRIGSGASFGLAIASKWSAAPLLVAAAALAFVWTLKTLEERARFGAIARQALAVVATFLVLPACIYVASYAPWFASPTRFVPQTCAASNNRIGQWLCYQGAMYKDHRDFQKFEKGSSGSAVNDYMSEAWSWPWIGRPTRHYTAIGDDATERIADVVGIPNPAIWWPAFFVAIPLLVWWTVRARDRIAMFTLFFIAVGYLPYLALGALGRPLFFFYMTPVVPFLVLAVTHVFYKIERAGHDSFIWHYVAVCVVMFAYFYPVLSAISIPNGGRFGWGAHMWINGDCFVKGLRHLCWR